MYSCMCWCGYDWENTTRMRLKATVMYDGSEFEGWQKQSKPHVRTVQGEIERAVSNVNKTKTRIFGSGRTDRGVHALGQVFHFDSELNLANSVWIRALNASLPGDIVVLDVEQVSDTFNARFDVISKTYQYTMNIGTYNMFERHYIYQYCNDVSVEKMQAAAELLIGEHDFTSFNATAHDEIPDQVRTIHYLDVVRTADYIVITLEGTGFLRYMVRMIVATLLAVSQGKITEKTVVDALRNPSKEVLQYNVPSCGLKLVKVTY